MMNVAQIRNYDISNGPGIRTSLFVSGCNHNCKGCFNKEYQDFQYGERWNEKFFNQLLNQLEKKEIQGLTLLGGEPMEHARELTVILKDLKNSLSSKGLKKDFWIYSGFTLEEIKRNEDMLNLLKECDVLVDGRFVESLKNPNLRFRGSSNQNIIQINEQI